MIYLFPEVRDAAVPTVKGDFVHSCGVLIEHEFLCIDDKQATDLVNHLKKYGFRGMKLKGKLMIVYK